jgi:hypothetical protein
LRFGGNEYDMAIALQNINTEGPCKADIIYYERGQTALKVIEDVTGQGDHFIGHGGFAASTARLVVRVGECGSDDGVQQYDLPPLTACCRWVYFGSDPARIILDCTAFPQNEWQTILCTADSTMPAFIRRP